MNSGYDYQLIIWHIYFCPCKAYFLELWCILVYEIFVCVDLCNSRKIFTIWINAYENDSVTLHNTHLPPQLPKPPLKDNILIICLYTCLSDSPLGWDCNKRSEWNFSSNQWIHGACKKGMSISQQWWEVSIVHSLSIRFSSDCMAYNIKIEIKIGIKINPAIVVWDILRLWCVTLSWIGASGHDGHGVK